MTTAKNPLEREGLAWQEFVKFRDPKTVPDIDPLFALPTKLIRAIEKHDASFWSAAERKFEDDLEQSSAGVFINRQTSRRLLARQFLLAGDFEDSFMLSKDKDVEEQRVQSLNADRDLTRTKLKSAEFTEKEIATIESEMDALENKVQRSRIAYAGWLVVNEAFLDELRSLKRDAPSSVGQNGRFPVMRFGYSQATYERMGRTFTGLWAPSNEIERQFDDRCQAFFQRWCLQSLFNWEVPVPLVGTDVPGLMPEGTGICLYLPWYVFKQKTPELPKVVEARVVKEYSGPLGEWLKTGKNSTGLSYYEHVFRMFVYFGLALCRRYPDKISERPTRLDRAFMEFFGLGKRKGVDVADPSSAKDPREELQSIWNFYSKSVINRKRK